MHKLGRGEVEYIEGGVRANVRVDGRSCLEHRTFTVQTGVIDSSNGSALVQLGETKVLVSVSAEIGQTQNEAKRGRLEVNVMSAPTVSGRLDRPVATQQRLHQQYNKMLALQLGRVLGASPPRDDRVGEIDPPGDDDQMETDGDQPAVRTSGIDYTKLHLVDDKCWVLHMDVLVLQHDGNILGCASIASRAALTTALIPKVTILEGADDNIEVSGNAADAVPLPGADSVPITVTMAKSAGVLITDPILREESCPISIFSVGVTPKLHVSSLTSSVHAGTGSSFHLHPAETQKMLDRAARIARGVFENLQEKLDEEGKEE